MAKLLVIFEIAFICYVLGCDKQLALTFFTVGSEFTLVSIPIAISIGTVSSIFHILINTSFELVSIGIFDDSSCRLHLIEVK